MLLWLFLREHGHICSHTFHNVVGVADGTIMVQRGYSLALDDHELLPLWMELLICRNIVGDVFDKENVK